MLENLLKLVKDNAGDAIINNPAVPNHQNNVAIETATTSIFESLKTQISGGNISDFANLFLKNNTQSSGNLSNAINSDLIKNLITKLGIDNNAATNIAETLIPSVLNNLANKTNDPNDNSFELKDIVSNLSNNPSTFTSIIDMIDGAKDGTTDFGGILNSVKGIFSK